MSRLRIIAVIATTVGAASLVLPAPSSQAAAPPCGTQIVKLVNTAIPDGNFAGLTSTITVPVNETVLDANVGVNFTHTWDDDLDLTLNHGATTIELSTDNGGGGDNFINTVFDDEAATSITAGVAPFSGSFRPEQALANFDGLASGGNWNIKLVDDASFDTGVLLTWTLTLALSDCDTDSDTIKDSVDNCDELASLDQADNDADGLGNPCDADDDNDGVPDTGDNCQFYANGDQRNSDGDPQGNACDDNDDNDSLADAADQCDTLLGLTASGCPEKSRRLSLNYTKAGYFKGQLTCADQACQSSDAVTIMKRRAGPDLKVARARTRGNGRFSVKRANLTGKFYAAVGTRVIPERSECEAATSPIEKVR